MICNLISSSNDGQARQTFNYYDVNVLKHGIVIYASCYYFFCSIPHRYIFSEIT